MLHTTPKNKIGKYTIIAGNAVVQKDYTIGKILLQST